MSVDDVCFDVVHRSELLKAWELWDWELQVTHVFSEHLFGLFFEVVFDFL